MHRKAWYLSNIPLGVSDLEQTLKEQRIAKARETIMVCLVFIAFLEEFLSLPLHRR